MHIRLKKGFAREPLWYTKLSEDLKIEIINYYVTVQEEEKDVLYFLDATLKFNTFSPSSRNGNTPDIPITLRVKLETESTNMTEIHAYRLIQDKIIKIMKESTDNSVELVKDTDICIEVGLDWKEVFGANLVVPRNIRVVIPKDLLLTNYEQVMYKVKQGWRTDGVADVDFPFVMTDKLVLVYLNNLSTLTVQELTYMNIDPNILVEFKNVV